MHVPALMEVESYAVHSLVSTVRGQRRPQVTTPECLRATFPGGSMTGAPKLRSMHILDGCSPLPLPPEVLRFCINSIEADLGTQPPYTLPQHVHGVSLSLHKPHAVRTPQNIQMSTGRMPSSAQAFDTDDVLSLGYCRLEGEARGIYSGSLGFISFNGAFDLNIVIRTAILGKDTIRIGAGGAIVVQSDPCDEYDEMRLKAKALLSAIGKAEGYSVPPCVDESAADAQ